MKKKELGFFNFIEACDIKSSLLEDFNSYLLESFSNNSFFLYEEDSEQFELVFSSDNSLDKLRVSSSNLFKSFESSFCFREIKNFNFHDLYGSEYSQIIEFAAVFSVSCQESSRFFLLIGSDIKYPSKEKIVELGNVFSQYCFLMQIREQNKTLIGLKKENAKLKDLSHMAQILEARKDKYLRDQQKLLALKTKEAVKARQEVEGSKLKLEQAHLELQELDREKSRFFQNISHEFRTPLTLIINSVENLLNLKGEPDPQLLRVAYNNSLRMLRLVNQLLDFQKLSLGKSKVELTPQNMFSFFRIVEDYFFSAANHQKVTLKPLVNGIPLSESEKEDSVWVLGNRDSLEKIVFNYLSNAIKFSPKNSEVILSLNFNEDSVTLSVKDQGPGISQEDQGKLFKVFSQVGNQGYSSSDGSGVGLALAKELTHIMGGSVSLESEEGEGAIFSSTFPRAKGDFESPSEEDTQKVQKSWYLAEHLDSNEKESPEEYEVELDTEDYSSGAVILGEKGKVLVVDDLKDMRIIIKRLLSSQGYKVLTCGDPEAALTVTRQERPDLIITDWMMPKITGPELIAKIRKNTQLSSIPIILLTAKADTESKSEGIEVGADLFLGKPFDEKELVSSVNNLVKLKAKEQEYERELKLASVLENEIHKGLISSYNDFRIDSFFQSCQQVGGDLQVTVPIDEDRLFFAQCDISGHGPRAALVSFFIRGILELSASSYSVEECGSEEAYLRKIAILLDDQFEEKIGGLLFSTAFLAVLSSKSNSMCYLSAGHPAGILLDNSDNSVTMLRSQMAPIGLSSLLSKEVAEPERISLPESFSFLVATDSIVELPGTKFEEIYFGEDRLVELFQNYVSENKERSGARGLTDYALRETGNLEFDDDCSIILLFRD